MIGFRYEGENWGREGDGGCNFWPAESPDGKQELADFRHLNAVATCMQPSCD